MAQRVPAVLIDDRDGSQAGRAVASGLGGAGYGIGLTAGHARALRDMLAR